MRTTRLLSIAVAAAFAVVAGLVQPAAADGFGERGPHGDHRAGSHFNGRDHDGGRFADRGHDDRGFADRDHRRGPVARHDHRRGPVVQHRHGRVYGHRHDYRHPAPHRHPVHRPPVRVYEKHHYTSDGALLPLAILLGAVLVQSAAH